jgi:hypothetical protein
MGLIAATTGVADPGCRGWQPRLLAERSSMTNGRGRSGPDRVPFAEHPHPGLCPQQAGATRQLQSSLRHHPRSRNCVRLCLSATCVDDSEPDPHDAGWRAATGYQPRPPAARCLAANRRTPCCRQPPGQAARGSVDNMSVVSTYRPRRLGRVRPGLALSLVPCGPSPFSSTPHKRPHRPDHRRPSLSPYRRHVPGSPYLLTYTPVVDSVAGQPAAEDEGVLL